MGSGESRIFTDLTDSDVNYLKKNTKFDEPTIRQWWGSFQQECPGGKMTRDQLIDLCKKVMPNMDVEEFGDHLMRVFDTDKDGYINFRELLLGLSSSSQKNEKDKLKNIFKIFDIDGNKEITFGEIVTVLKASHGALYSEEDKEAIEDKAGELMQKLDKNQDGVVTQEEFNDALKTKKPKKLLTLD